MNKNSLEIIIDSPSRRTPRNIDRNKGNGRGDGGRGRGNGGSGDGCLGSAGLGESGKIKIDQTPQQYPIPKYRSQLHEYFIFQILLHSSHLLLSLYINKSALAICNDTVFLTIGATAIYYLSFPWMIWDRYQKKFYQKLERKPYLKTCPCSIYTDSVLYLTSFCFSIIVLLVFDYPPWNKYVLSTRDIPHWNIELWGIFFLNTVLTLPVVVYNFRQAYLYEELSYHIAGFLVIIFFLFFPYLIHTSINIHLHHWFLFFYLSLFSRFPTRLSRSFHGMCMGVFVHGISLYSPDPIFE